MKPHHKCRNSFRRACSKIHLIDKCLIIIMFLLLLQSSYSLFFATVSSAELNAIDIIIRTATASIFGYFLSSNFIYHKGKELPEENTSMKITSNDPKENLQSGEESFRSEEDAAEEQYPDNHLQIIITTFIAVFCLVVLTVVRNTSAPGGDHFTASAQATIVQFRDIISGCIGFLIGIPTTKN